jgi:hypothetical protein
MVSARSHLAAGAHDEQGEAKRQQHQRLFYGRSSYRVGSCRDPSAQDKNSGRRLDAKAVVTAMPAVKARARVMAVFFMAISLFSIVDVARTGQELP